MFRRLWTDVETLAFLQCYEGRKSEMSQARKKVFGFQNILGDLDPMEILEAPTTVANLQSKWTSLQRAYQCAKYAEAKMGKDTSGFIFMENMDDILGDSAPKSFSSSNALSTSEGAPSTYKGVSSTSKGAPSTSKSAPSTSKGAPSKSKSTGNERRILNWTDAETRALLSCYESRKDELQHPVKQKYFYKNILEDFVSLKVLTCPTTEANLEGKMDSLLQAYKSAHDAEELSGRGSSTFMYMTLMDDIFGDRPIIANSLTLNLYGQEVQALPIERVQKKVLFADVAEEPLNEDIEFDPEEHDGMKLSLISTTLA